MFAFIEQIGHLIVSVIGAVLHFFGMLIYSIELIIKMIALLPSIINYLPTFLGSFVILTILLCVLLFRILNRE